jgi:hypothetical protein
MVSITMERTGVQMRASPPCTTAETLAVKSTLIGGHFAISNDSFFSDQENRSSQTTEKQIKDNKKGSEMFFISEPNLESYRQAGN